MKYFPWDPTAPKTDYTQWRPWVPDDRFPKKIRVLATGEVMELAEAGMWCSKYFSNQTYSSGERMLATFMHDDFIETIVAWRKGDVIKTKKVPPVVEAVDEVFEPWLTPVEPAEFYLDVLRKQEKAAKAIEEAREKQRKQEKKKK